jgi:hypothetical protein
MVKFLQPSGLLKIAICAAAVMGFSFSESAYAVSTPVARVNSIGATITPAEGEVTELQSFEITFPGVTTIETVAINGPTVAPALVGPAGDAPHTYYAMSVTVDGNKLSFSTQSAAVGYGEFTLSVPGALYTLDGVQGQDLTFNYTIVKSEKTVAYSITPVADEDGNVSTISPIVVTFDNATKVEANPNANYYTQYALVEYQGKSKEDWEEAVIEEQIQSKSILYFIDEADTKDVTDRVYRLTIPAGTYLVDGVENPKIVQEFHYVVPSQDKFVALPAAGEVEGLQNFEIEFPAATAVAATFSRDAYPVLYNVTDGHNEFSFTSATVDGNKMTLSMNAAVAYMGDYELRIPAGCYKLDGEAGEAITLAYKVVQSEKTFEYTITPADGETIESFSSVVVTFPNIRKIALDDSDVYPLLEVYDEDYKDWAEVDVNYEASANQLVITVPSYVTMVSGKYNLTIPAKFISGDNVVYASDILSSFTLQQAVPEFATVIDPAEGPVSSLKSFNIVFKNIDTFLKNDYSATTMYYIEKEDGSKVSASESYINEDAEGAPLYIEFAEEITAAGKYTLVLPAGSYKVNGILGNELSFKYTIVDKTAYQVLIDGVAISDGDEVDGVKSGIVLEFPNATEVVVDDSIEYPVVNENSAKYGWGESGDFGYAGTEGNQILFDVYNVNASGEYEVYIPAGIVTVDGETIKGDISVMFSIKEEVPEFTTTINPAEGTVSSLKNFDIIFNGVSTIQANNYNTDTQYYIEDAAGSKTYSSDAFINYDAETGATPLHIEFSEITTDGEYTLVLPAGSYKVDGVSGNELRFKYTVDSTSAVSSIFVNGVDSVDVYDLRGVRVLNNAKAADLRNLDSNVYIINGQKYLLRK